MNGADYCRCPGCGSCGAAKQLGEAERLLREALTMLKEGATRRNYRGVVCRQIAAFLAARGRADG